MAPKRHYVSWKKDEMVCMVELDRACEYAWIIGKFHIENYLDF